MKVDDLIKINHGLGQVRDIEFVRVKVLERMSVRE